MAKYAQNTTCGNTCPWGSADDTQPTDAFTLAAQKAAAKRRDSQDTCHASSVKIAHGPDTGRVAPEEPEKAAPSGTPDTGRSVAKSTGPGRGAVVPPTGRSTASAKVKEEVEKKMMNLIEQCLDKKVTALREELTASKTLAPPPAASACSASDVSGSALSTSRTEVSTVTQDQEAVQNVTLANKRAQIHKLSDASLGKFDADASRVAFLEMQKSAAEARNKNRSGLCFDYQPSAREVTKTAPKKGGGAAKGGAAKKEAKAVEKAVSSEKPGYEALERYPALLKEINDLSQVRREAPEGLTSNGKQKQAMKLSDASLGKFDADESRLAFLEMQKSAADARNKNRSALTFGDDTGSNKNAPVASSKDVTLAEKREKAKKLSDASLKKYDADASQIAYLDMQNTAAEMRNKNRVGQGIF